jgi:hypothetical protein
MRAQNRLKSISFTYKMHDGYAPIFAYAGTEGYMLDCELRPGKQHCQKADKNRTAEHHLLRRPAGTARRSHRVALGKHCPWFAVFRHCKTRATRLKRIYCDPTVGKTALDIENQAAVCFSPPHCRSLEFNFSLGFQREELSNGFR